MSVRWGILASLLCVLGAGIGFAVQLGEQDRISEPVLTAVSRESGDVLEWVPQPLSRASCVPGTITLAEEPYVSGDEGLSKPVYRCTAWARPLTSAAIGFFAAVALTVLLGSAQRLTRRSQA